MVEVGSWSMWFWFWLDGDDGRWARIILIVLGVRHGKFEHEDEGETEM